MNALDTPNKTLFLSYSRKQTAWCDSLYTAIDTYTNFYRWRDNKIPESADWWDSICLNIEGCYAFIAILTPNYLDSVYCTGELEYALKLNKPVIALMLQDVNYPPKLNDMRLQFARVDSLDMREVIAKVLNATNQITLGYVQHHFSTEIHPRKQLRPPVPSPKASAHISEEDEILEKQISEIAGHGQIPTRDLIRRYGEEKGRNIILARELLNKIIQRDNIPSFFKTDRENQNLEIAEQKLAEEEKSREELNKIAREYDDLAHYIETLPEHEALILLREFMQDNPDYGDPKNLRRKFLPASKNLMPAPFDWIEIERGRGTMRTDESSVTLSIPTEKYWIAKYPVTNAQFHRFIDAGGYQTEKWWTKQGWQQKQNEAWTEPHYWVDRQFLGDDKPVVGVSWYEAVAFCLWLSEVTGEKIMLPTEAQWQYAAQGNDNRIYPWGNDWDASKCPNSVGSNNAGKTGSVIQFEGKGDSPLGVVDMAGNVWEWCLTDYESTMNDMNSNANIRVLRGGSWNANVAVNFRCDYRSYRYPHLRNNHNGFRISCS